MITQLFHEHLGSSSAVPLQGLSLVGGRWVDFPCFALSRMLGGFKFTSENI